MLEIRTLVRVAHILAGAAWVGGSLFYLVVVQPALRSFGPAPVLAAKIAELFKRMVNICVGVLLLTGGYLVFDRLTQTTLGLPYLIVLGIKIVAALGMFVLAMYMAQSNIRRLAKRSTRLSRAAPQLMLALGILIFILGALLNGLFEMSIAPH
ncbi:MAG TPA: CopD family protein [Ktedonobacteraceae bacterium]|jgi:putative copper export protein